MQKIIMKDLKNQKSLLSLEQKKIVKDNLTSLTKAITCVFPKHRIEVVERFSVTNDKYLISISPHKPSEDHRQHRLLCELSVVAACLQDSLLKIASTEGISFGQMYSTFAWHLKFVFRFIEEELVARCCGLGLGMKLDILLAKSLAQGICRKRMSVSSKMDVIKPFITASVIIAKTGQAIPIN